MFGTYKTKRNRFRLNGKFLRNVNPTATLTKNVVFAWMKSSWSSVKKNCVASTEETNKQVHAPEEIDMYLETLE